MLDRALRLEKNIDWGQFVTTITDTLIVPNGKVAENASSIPLQMGQDVTDTLVDDGIESLSQHQPLSTTMEAANALGTIMGDGLVYGGRYFYSNYRENKSLQPLADSLDTDLKLGNPLANSLAGMNLGVSGLDLTFEDIYGPAQQAPPQSSAPVRSAGTVNNVAASSNAMNQQNLSAAEQAANQAAANTQMQLQGQRVVQNGMAMSGNFIASNDDAFFNQLLSQSSQPTGFLGNHPKINNIIDEAEDTASMFGNLLMSSPAGLELDLVGMGIVKAGMFAKNMVINPLSAAQSIQSTVVGGLSRFGLFGGLSNDVQRVLDELDGATDLSLGLHNLDPKIIKFTQPTVSPYFSTGGRVDELVSQLQAGTVSPYDLPPIQVVQKDGALFAIDNRRLLAFNMAQLDQIPVEIVSLDDPAVLDRYQYRTDPILDQGNYVVVATQAERSAALDTLYEYNMIKGIHLGY